MAGVSITLLGGFAATVDGEPVPDRSWRLNKARDLVKLLALSPGQRLHREQAMDALWPDRPPDAAANNLYQAVHAARRALGPEAIEVRDQLITLVADVDVVRFQEAADEARRMGTAAAYRAALSLLDDDLLPENRYDDWAEARRDDLDALRTTLRVELDQLGGAVERLGLPADASSFIGRDRELGQLRTLLGRTRLLTLVGTGGAGKTRLALELARTVEPGYPDGAALVELAVATTPERTVDALAAALDVHALPGRSLLDASADFLAGRSLLLVVDNCEHLLGASAMLIDTILRAAPRVTIVATSREPLRAAGEVVFRVPSLAMPDPDGLPELAELIRYESVRLFIERADAAAPGFTLAAENAGDVARICLRLDGLPLALELAAGRTGALSPATIAERLNDRFRLLATGSQGAPTRQQTLAATLDWSHELLEEHERVLLRRLSVFAGTFDVPAVEAVCGGDGLEVDEAAHLLGRLVEKSLVAFEGQDPARRYRLLETVRFYARERLDRAGETAALRDRHARWALELAERERASRALDVETPNLYAALDTLTVVAPEDALRLCVALWPFWLRRIELAEANRWFTSALAATPDDAALRGEALLAASALDLRAGELERGLARAEESLATLGADDPRKRWRALQFLGGYAITFAGQGEIDAAVSWFEQGLEIAETEGFAAEAALGVYSLGVTHWMGGLPDTEELLGRGLDLFRELEDDGATIPSPINIVEIRPRRGADRPGLPIILEETMQPFFEVSGAEATAYVLANCATAARSRGDFVRARGLLNESADAFAALSNEQGEAHVLVRRAYLDAGEGSVGTAQAHLERALEIRRRLNDRRGVGLALTGLGFVLTEAGNYAEAERALTEARELFRRAGDRWGLVNALWRLADLELARRDPDRAEAALQDARAVLDERKIGRWVAHTVAGLAEVALLHGDVDGARELFADARARYAAAADTFGAEAVGARLADL